MVEYVADAIVLNREPNGDLDCRFSLFTKTLGKFVVKAKSVRKITSKLSGHLNVGSLSGVRIIEKNGLQVVDALQKSRLNFRPIDLYFLDRLLPEAEPEPALWHELTNGSFSWRRALKVLGWDPNGVSCYLCNGRGITVFDLASQDFLCQKCSLSMAPDRLIYL